MTDNSNSAKNNYSHLIPDNDLDLAKPNHYVLMHERRLPTKEWLVPGKTKPSEFVIKIRDCDGAIVTMKGFPTFIPGRRDSLSHEECKDLVSKNPALSLLLIYDPKAKTLPVSAVKAACEDDAIDFAFYRENFTLRDGEVNFLEEPYDELSYNVPAKKSKRAN